MYKYSSVPATFYCFGGCSTIGLDIDNFQEEKNTFFKFKGLFVRRKFVKLLYSSGQYNIVVCT